VTPERGDGAGGGVGEVPGFRPDVDPGEGESWLVLFFSAQPVALEVNALHPGKSRQRGQQAAAGTSLYHFKVSPPTKMLASGGQKAEAAEAEALAKTKAT
jgi:hypothetical protein